MTGVGGSTGAPASRRVARRRSLVGAEVLRLRRRRALMITLVMLTFGLPAIIAIVILALHLSNPSRYPPGGGYGHFQILSVVLAMVAPIGAVLVGASAGSADVSAGVFRSLVTTGRPRPALFLARVAGMIAVVVPTLVITITAICVYSIGLSDGRGQPSISTMTHVSVWIMLVVLTYGLIALGFSAIVGSRSVTVGVMLAISLVAAPLLGSPFWHSFLGYREAFFGATLEILRPHILGQDGGHPTNNEAAWLSVVILAVWIGGILLLGLWRTNRRDA